MKICPKCNTNKVKNSYQHCYTCNMKDDISTEPDIDKDGNTQMCEECIMD